MPLCKISTAETVVAHTTAVSTGVGAMGTSRGASALEIIAMKDRAGCGATECEEEEEGDGKRFHLELGGESSKGHAVSLETSAPI